MAEWNLLQMLSRSGHTQETGVPTRRPGAVSGNTCNESCFDTLIPAALGPLNSGPVHILLAHHGHPASGVPLRTVRGVQGCPSWHKGYGPCYIRAASDLRQGQCGAPGGLEGVRGRVPGRLVGHQTRGVDIH